jgi:hypothetical protein
MQSTVRRIAGMTLLLLLAACSLSQQPWTLSQSPDVITMRWYPDESNVVAANQLAARHCAAFRKSARLTTDLQDGSAEVAQYRCI